MPKAKTRPKAKPRARARPRARRAALQGELPHISLSSLKPPRGSHRVRIRKGRGPGSGIGKTAGRGGKGQTARSGGQTRPGVEGGQMPLIRRIPKRGFTNPFKQPAQLVNVPDLAKLADGADVTSDTLFGAGLVRRPDHPVKLLGRGDVAREFAITGFFLPASGR